MIIYTICLQFFGILLIHALPPAPMPIRKPYYGQLPIEARDDPKNMANGFASLISRTLTPEQCIQLNQYFSSHETLVLEAVNNLDTKSRNKIHSGMRQLLGPANRSGKECLVKLEDLLKNNLYDLKGLVYEGLVHINRNDLSEQLRSWVNHRKHTDIMKAMSEIRRHSNSVPTTDKVEQWSKAIMDLLSDGYDEYRYRILIYVLISSTLVTFIIAKSVISAKSNSKSIANFGKVNSEAEKPFDDQRV